MTYRSYRVLSCLAAACLMNQEARADLIVDQEQEVFSSYLFVFGTSSGLFVPWSVAQSFVPAASNIAGADIFVQNSGFAGSRQIEVALFDFGGNQIAGDTVTFNQTNATAGFVTVEARWSPEQVVSGLPYFLVLGGAQPLDLLVWAAMFDPYPAGDMLSAQNRSGALEPERDRDLAFRIYTETGPSAIPEPASTVLLASGLVALAVWRRRTACGR